MPARRPSSAPIPPEVSRLTARTTPGLPPGETVLDALSDAIVVVDAEWRIVFANRAFGAVGHQLGGRFAVAVGENFLDGFMSQFEQTRPERADRAAPLPPLELLHPSLQCWLEAWTTAWNDLTLVHLKDISERKRGEFHGEFLAQLNDDLSRLTDPADILKEASRAIGLHLNVDRCYFCELSADAAEIRVAHDWARAGFQSVAGTHYAADFGTPAMWTAMSRGPVAVSDVNQDPLASGQGPGYEQLRVQAHVSVPYLRDGVWTASIAVTTELPRGWRKDELEVLAHALARVWPFFEQARSQQALRDSEARRENLIRSLPVACYTIDAQGRLTFFNAAATRLWGREPQLHSDFWCGAAGLTTLDGQPIAPGESAVARALRERRPMPTSEAWLFRPDGSRRRIVAQPNPLFNAQGDCFGVVCVVLDVTDEKLAHEEARKAADRLNVALSSANLGDWEWDAATDEMKLSARCAEIYGFATTTGLTRSGMRQALHPEDRPRSLAALQHALATRSDYAIEYRVVWPDGSLHWVAAKGRSLFSASGETIGMVGVIQDITDRKRQVEDLQALTRKIEAQTRLFDATLSNLNDLAYAFDREGLIIFANRPLLTILGRQLDEVVGRDCTALNYSPEVTAQLREQIVHVVNTGQSVRAETLFTDRQGRVDFHEYILNPVREPDGSISAVVGSTRVITERKLAEEALRDARYRLEATLSGAEIGTWLWDISNNWVKADKNMTRMFGLPAQDEGAPIENYVNLIHPDDRARVTREIREALVDGEFESDYRLLAASGELRWYTARGRVQRDPQGRAVSFPGVLIDITERKRHEEALAKLSQRIEDQARIFNTVLSHITDFAYIFDPAGRFRYANQPLLDLWRLPLDQVIGKTCAELNYSADLAQRLQQQVEQVVATGKAVRDEASFAALNGEVGRYEYIFNPIIGSDGRVDAVAGSTRDITERKRTEAVGDGQREVLQLIIEDAPLGQILDVLLRTVEAGSSRRLFATVMLLVDDALVVGSAPSLPASYTKATDGIKIGPDAGSCGQAAWSKEPLFVGDIATAPSWTEWRDVALQHQLRACWSTPILASDNTVLGVLAMYYPEVRTSSSEDLSLIDLATRTAAIAIENKRAAAALRQSDDHLRLALDAARLGSWVWDAATGEVKSSTRCKANFGVPAGVEAFTEQDYSDRIHPEDAERVEALTQTAARTTEGYEMEYRVIWPDGSVHWIVESGRGLADDAGRITKVVGVTYEITERKLAEESLRRSEAQLRMVTDHAPVLLVRVDSQHRYTFVNRAYAERLGVSAESLYGRRAAEIVGQAAYETFRDQMDRALAGHRVEFEAQVPYEKLGQRWIHAIYVPEYDRHGAVTGLLGVITDIAARKAAEIELKRARDEALAASQAKDNFLAALSHELRTPLNPVLLVASNAAVNAALAADVRADFELIRKNVDLEARLIDDLLDLTRITRGKLLLEKRRCDLHEVLADAIANVRADMAEKELVFHSHLEAGATEVVGDPVRLQQVFWNILKNAVKFTPHGGRVTLRTTTDPITTQIVTTVSDTGIGMTAPEIDRAFQAFAQGEHATGNTNLHRFGGLGLGLAISKMLVDLHGGRIEARSAGRDQGAAFTVLLPLRTGSEPEDLRPAISVSGRGAGRQPADSRSDGGEPVGVIHHVLLVEDHGPTRVTLHHLLELRGFAVIAAKSSAEALAFAAATAFDLVISDVGLPDRNGYDLISDLRARQPSLRAIALSGYGMEEDLVRSERAGFQAHLVKPVTIGTLEHAIASLPGLGPDQKPSSP